MIIKHVKNLIGGEVLAEPVITKEKEILIAKDTELKPEYLDLLLFLGIDAVCIKDPYAAYERPHFFLTEDKTKDFIESIKKILESHIYSGKEGLKETELLAEDLFQQTKEIASDKVFDLKERNGTLYDHTIITALLTIFTAKNLQLKEKQVFSLIMGSLLHDLGLRYISVPYQNQHMDSCSPLELSEYRKHTVFAYTVLEKENWISPLVKKMILSHHEKKDGSGFPLHQKTTEIECKILQTCDTFDRMISGIESRRTNVRSVLEYFAETSDILYEKEIVDVLEKIIARYPVGTKVKLNTGEFGVVTEQTKDSVHPIVAVLNRKGVISGEEYNLLDDKNIVILELPE